MRYFLRCLLVGAFCFLSLVSAQPAAAATATNWTTVGYGPAHQRVNPYETILSKTTVARLTHDWTVSTGGVIQSLDTIVSNNIAYFTSDDGNLYAVSASTGVVLWKKSLVSLDGSDLSSPAIANGALYLCTSAGDMDALNAKTGALLWTNSSISCNSSSSATVVQNTIFIGGQNNVLYALNAGTGKVLWSDALSTTPASINGAPAVVNGMVYVAFNGAGFQAGFLYALNSSTGAIKWSYELGTQQGVVFSPVVADGLVFIGAEGILYAFNASNGKQKWTSNIGIEYAAPAVFDKMVYIGGNGLTLPDTKIFALSESTGSPIWTVNTKADVFSSASVASGVVYDVSVDGKIYALDARTGAILWTGTAGSCPTGNNCTLSSPVVVNGILYQGGSDGRMYAFHLATWFW